MTSIVLHSTSGPDGKLHLEVPVGSPNTEFRSKWCSARRQPRGRFLPDISTCSGLWTTTH